MYLELVGLPGAGKSSLARQLLRRIDAYDKYGAIASRHLRTECNPRLRRLFALRRLVGKQARLYDAWAFDVLEARSDISQRVVAVSSALYRTCDHASDQAKQHVPLLQRALERDVAVAWLAHEKSVPVVNDDGILQRLVSLCGLRRTGGSAGGVQGFVDAAISALPPGTAVAVVQADPREALARCRERRSGLPVLLRSLEGDLEERFDSAAAFVDRLTGCLDGAGVVRKVVDRVGEDGVSALQRWILEQGLMK